MAKLRFINAGDGNTPGGNGTTNATSGANRAYISLSAAEAAEQAIDNDLSSTGIITFSCEGTTNDTTKVLFAGYINASASNYILVITSGTGIHDGTADTGYVITTSSGHVIEIDIPFTRIGNFGVGLDIKSTSTTTSDEGIRFDLGAADLQTCYAVANIVRSTTATSQKDGIYVNPHSGGGRNLTLNAFVNIIYGWNRGGIHAQNFQGTGTVLLNAIHNVLHGNGTGDISAFETSTNVTTVDSFNNICASTNSFVGAGTGSVLWTGSNNVTLDANFNLGSMTAGAQATSGIATTTKTTGAWIVFVNITGGSEDYSLFDEAAGNLPVDFGADKTATVPNDAIGNAYSTTPDNGALEFQGGGPVTLLPTSIASAESFGTTTIVEGGVDLLPTAIPSAEAFGTATLVSGTITLQPTSILSAEAFGTPTIISGGVILEPGSIASAEVFGIPIILGGVPITAENTLTTTLTFSLTTDLTRDLT